MNPIQREALIALERQGKLTPQTVVEAARPETSVLHELFEWNSLKAAEAYRMDQARTIIRSVLVNITVTRPVQRTIEIVRYVPDPSRVGREQGYISLEGPLSIETQHKVAHAEASRALALMERATGIAAALGLENDAPEIMRRWASWRDTFTPPPDQQDDAADTA